MKKLFLSLLLLAGCYREPVHFPAPNMKLMPVLVHTINEHYTEYTAPKALNKANLALGGSASLLPLAFTDKNIPTSYEEDKDSMPQESDPIIDVYYFLTVADEDFNEVGGMMVPGEDICSSYIVINGENAREDTLVHELGHFFGLEHTQDKENIMSLDRTWQARFNRDQLVEIHENALEYRRKCRVDFGE